jgi:pimeloyl-ACP methyl ester carboxylesterase
MPRGQQVKRAARRYAAADALPPSRPLTVRAGDGTALHAEGTGDVLRHVKLAAVPRPLTTARVLPAESLLRSVGAAPLPRAADRPSKRFVTMMAAGRDADPSIGEFVYELFAQTPAASRGGWARTLIDSLGPHRHIGLHNLTVPTLVIGSEKDRLLPMVSSRHIAKTAPNLAQFVELSGGHCAILEHPDEVNRHLRGLVESVAEPRRATS